MIKNIKELFQLIEEVKKETKADKILVLYGTILEDEISEIKFPDYVELQSTGLICEGDKIYIFKKDFYDDPPVKFHYHDPLYNNYINALFENT